MGGAAKSGCSEPSKGGTSSAAPIDDGQSLDVAQTQTGTQRLDKWLWFTRIVKTRSLASKMVSGGKVRVNQVRCTKPSTPVRAEDVITAMVGRDVRVLRVLAPGKRRGPASEAVTIYEDLAPIERQSSGKGKANDLGIMIPGAREPGSGRPTKRERRQLDKLRSTDV